MDDENKNEGNIEDTSEATNEVTSDDTVNLDDLLDEFLGDDEEAEEEESLESDKQKNLDYEEEDRIARVKLFKRLAIVAAAAVVAIAAGFFGYRIYYNFSHSYFLTVDGNRVSIEDFKFFAMTDVSEDDIIDWYLDLVVYSKAKIDYNLTFSPDERRDLTDRVNSILEAFENMDDAPKIKEARLYEIFELFDGFLHEKMLDVFMEGATVQDRAEMEDQFAFYLENFGYDYTYIDFKYIYTMSLDVANNAVYDMAVNGMSFDEAAVSNSIAFDEANAIAFTITLDTLAQFLDPVIINELMMLEPGDISRSIELPGGDGEHLMLMVAEKIETDIDELRGMFENYFISYEVSWAFEEWRLSEREKLNFTVNQRAIDRLYEELFK